MSSLGSGNIGTSQRTLPSNGPPFSVTSAENGLSVNALGRIVLGQDVGAVGNPAILLSNREIPMNGFSFAFTDNFGVQPQGTYFLGDDAGVLNGSELLIKDNLSSIQLLTKIGAAVNANALVIAGGANPVFTFGDQGVNNKGLRILLNDGADFGFIDNKLHNALFGFFTQVPTRSVDIFGNYAATQVGVFGATDSNNVAPYPTDPLIKAPYMFVGSGQPTATNTVIAQYGAVQQNALCFYRTRGAAPDTKTALVAGDVLGNLTWFGVDSTNTVIRSFRMFVDTQTVGAGIVSSEWLLQSMNNVGTFSTRVKLTEDGRFILSTGNIAGNASAKLQVESTTQGFAQPRMTQAQKNAIVAPLIGLTVFDTTWNQPSVFDGLLAWRSVIVGADAAAAPATLAAVAPANVYGAANGNYLGDPVGWAAVTISGNNYKIPLYT